MVVVSHVRTLTNTWIQFDSKTRLGLVTTVISKSEELVSDLKEGEREL